MGQNSEEIKSPSWWYFILPAIFVFTVWILWPQFLSWYVGNNELNNWSTKGTMGDSFGSLNTLFSGLAFSALAYTMWMQRSELAETRKILSSQKEEAEQQNQTLARQTFENTFFHLLRIQTELSSNAEISHHGIHRGRHCFSSVFDLAMSALNNGQVTELNRGGFSDSFSLHSSKIDNVIFTYIRHLVGILEFIENSDVLDKRLYANMLRNLLSNDEQKLLMICAIADLGDSTRLLELSKKFELLRHVNMSDHKQMLLLKTYEDSI